MSVSKVSPAKSLCLGLFVSVVFFSSVAVAEEGADTLAMGEIAVEMVESGKVKPAPLPDADELSAFDGSAGSVGGIAAPSAVSSAADEDSFFDAEDLIPQSEMAKDGPNKVDPSLQPGSSLIIVRKNSEMNSEEAHLVSAERAMALGRYDSALHIFTMLYQNSKKDERVLMGRAIVLQKLGRFDEAMKMYEALSKVQPNNLEARINMLGLLGTRFPAVALRQLVDLHNKNQGNAALTAQVGYAYARSGNVSSALQHLGVAASMEPQNASHLYNMAVIADRAGDVAQATSYYEKALEVDTVHGSGRTIPRDAVYTRLAQIR